MRKSNKDDSSVRYHALRDAIPLFVTATIGAALDWSFQDLFHAQAAERFQVILLLVICAFSLLGVSLIYYINRYIDETERSKVYSVHVWRDRPEIRKGRQSPYDFCSAIAKQAEQYIHVIGPHFTEESSHVSVGTESHDEYLTEGMAAAINRHIVSVAAGGEAIHRFEYLRIIQMDEGKRRGIDEDGHADAHLIPNDALTKHLVEVMESSEGADTLDVKIFARDFVPSMPSILVVDDRWVFFSLPSYTGGQSLKYNFVLGIEDRTGKIPAEFSNLIRQISKEGRQIKKIKVPPKVTTPVG